MRGIEGMDGREEFTAEAQRWRRVAEFLFGEVVNEAPDSVFEKRDVEIDEQAQGAIAHPKVGEDLGGVDGLEHLDHFYFHDDLVFNEEIDAIGVGNYKAL